MSSCRDASMPSTSAAALSTAPLTPGPKSKPPITLRGAFPSINGLTFDGKKLKNGRELIEDNLFNIEVEEVQGADQPTGTIRARMFHTTNVTETPYLIEFKVDLETRNVISNVLLGC